MSHINILLLFLLSSCTPTKPALKAELKPVPYLLHLPGIGGEMRVDRRFIGGIDETHSGAITEVYDWTQGDPGIDALLAYDRNKKQAKIIAQKIARQFESAPGGKIYMTCHSGGGGLAAWALEDLPDEVKIDSLVMMSPALSPTYDLTKALRHVTGHVYVFSSLADVFILSTGTRMFGTIDGVKTDAAGRVGFTMPATADPEQYKKLVQFPYRPSWSKYGDMADHIGGMTRLFAREVISPLVFDGKMPVVEEPTTQAVK